MQRMRMKAEERPFKGVLSRQKMSKTEVKTQCLLTKDSGSSKTKQNKTKQNKIDLCLNLSLIDDADWINVRII